MKKKKILDLIIKLFWNDLLSKLMLAAIVIAILQGIILYYSGGTPWHFIVWTAWSLIYIIVRIFK